MNHAFTENQMKIVFEKLIVHNYKMHKHTELPLSVRPLTTISGANGSGKTQLLEALIMAVGHTPKRVSISSFSEAIGAFDEKCTIELWLNNITLNSTRLIQSTDPELSSIVDSDTFIIETEIRKDNSVKRKIKTKEGNSVVLTKKQLQSLMKNIGIHDDILLNFAEEGYLDSFADGTPKRKLESLLSATGLKTLYENYDHSSQRLRAEKKDFSPLLRQLEKMEEKLRVMEENYERLQKKGELLKRFDYVQKERVWFDYLKINSSLNEMSSTLKQKENEKSKIEEKVAELSKELDTLDVKITSLNEEEKQMSYLKEKSRDKKNRFEGQLEGKQNRIKQLDSEIKTIDSKMEELKEFDTEKGLNKQFTLQKEINHFEQSLKQIDEDIRGKRSEIEKKEKEIIDYKKTFDDNSVAIGQLSPYELNLTKESSTFKDAINNSHYSDSIIGPLFQIVSIKDDYLSLEQSIKAALGRSLFDFIAISAEAYEEAKRLYDKLFTYKKPNFTVGRVLSIDSEIPSVTTSQEGIIGHVLDLISTDDRVLTYLKRFVRTVIAEPYLTANVLTTYAQQNKVNVLTTDVASYYLQREAFGRPPNTFSIKLGINYQKYLSHSRVRERIDSHRNELEVLKHEETELRSRRVQFLSKKKEVEQELTPWTLNKDQLELQFSALSQRRDAILAQNNNECEEILLLEQQISDLSNDVSQIERDSEKVRKELFYYSQQKEELDKERNRLNEKKKKLIWAIEALTIEKRDTEKKVEQALEAAKSVGEQPETIREDYKEILNEFYSLKNQLELLDLSENVSLDGLNEQREKVLDLEEKVKKTEEHLTSLQKDVEKRLGEIQTDLQFMVNHLNQTLAFLLKDIFSTISVSIQDYSDFSKAGLYIEAETKGDNRVYRQLSGGEKTLIAQAIILAIQKDSCPIHVIDEFTQKLDKKNRSYAFSMVLAVYNHYIENYSIEPQFILICPNIDDINLPDIFARHVLIETKV